mmetsp:Transcript_31381/g.45133  ORF Transcript_31381/g.45133 Transcript_31381/m.45133 type:complete len:1278 (-) Transcript_31381:297-4130(-)
MEEQDSPDAEKSIVDENTSMTRTETAVNIENLERRESSENIPTSSEKSDEIVLDSTPESVRRTLFERPIDIDVEEHKPVIIIQEEEKTFLISKKFVIIAVVIASILAAALVILLVLFVSPVLKKDNNDHNIPTIAPVYKIALPKPGPVYNILHTQGTQIVDRRGQPIRLTGCNWYGFETKANIPQGLWQRSYTGVLDQVKSLGFNTIRIAYSNQMLRSDAVTSGIDFVSNPNLKGLTPLQCLDKIIEYCGSINLRVILDRHSSKADNYDNENYWYIPGDAYYTEQRFIDDWVMLAQRYQDSAIVGADLWNDPKGQATTWGSGNVGTDWNLAAERVGNAIQNVNNRWLMIVEGVGNATWWGSNLMGVDTHPIRLQVPNKVVYSVHEYANDTFTQTWFKDPNFPNNLRSVWDKFFGFIIRKNIAPVMIGEFGTTFRYHSSLAWITKWMSYMDGQFTVDGVSDLKSGQYGLSFTSWPLNPYGGIGGILNDDWLSVNTQKMYYLTPSLAPIISNFNNTYLPTKRPTSSPTLKTAIPTPGPTFKFYPFDYFHTFGNQIVDKNNVPARIAGTTWSGFESTSFIPLGLWARSYKTVISQMKQLGFNTIKLPFSNQMLRSGSVVLGPDFTRNNDLVGLSPLQCMDMIVNYCGVVGMRVILTRFSALAGNSGNEMLWYVPKDNYYTHGRFVADWVMLADRYRNTAVIGFDLWNAPKLVTWGSQDPLTDWHMAAEEVGNAILARNSKLLVIVEGTGWGSTLASVASQTVNLLVPNKVVYSLQLYSNDTVPQAAIFSDPTFPDNLPARWDIAFGFIFKKQIAPLYISEFAAALQNPSDTVWIESFTHYLAGYFDGGNVSSLEEGSLGISWTAWPITPYGGIKGILQTDWLSVDSARMSLLNSTFPSPSLISNQTGVAIPEVSTTYDPSTTFYMGSYDDIITQWAYTSDRDIKFQGTVVSGLASAPSWLSYSADFKYVYATLEYANRVQAYEVNPNSGALRLINSVPSMGGSPCFISVDPLNRFLLVANYFSGNMTVLRIDSATGALMPTQQVLSHTPAASSHLHAAVIQNKYATVMDKGLDTISQYLLSDTGIASTDPVNVINAPAGTGSTHIKFHPDGKFAISLNALSVSVTLIPADPDTGLLQPMDATTFAANTYSTLMEAESNVDITSAEVVISPNGNYVYASNRDVSKNPNPSRSSISVFAVTEDPPNSFSLTLVQKVSSLGNYPRYFQLLNGGSDLVLVNQLDNTFVSYEVNPVDGLIDTNSAVISKPKSPALLQPSYTLFQQ